ERWAEREGVAAVERGAVDEVLLNTVARGHREGEAAQQRVFDDGRVNVAGGVTPRCVARAGGEAGFAGVGGAARNDRDRAAFGTAAEQGALRPFQHFNTFEVEKLHYAACRAADRYPVKKT